MSKSLFSSTPLPASSTGALASSGSTWASTGSNSGDTFSGKNLVILVLVALLVLSFVGINLLTVSGNVVDGIAKLFGPVFANLLAMVGYSGGELLNNASDAVASTAKFGIDVANGTVHSVGNLMKGAAMGAAATTQPKNLEQAVRSPKTGDSGAQPVPVLTTDAIVSKGDWCYIGEYAGSRGCVAMADHGKCMSGQVFPSQVACLRADPNQLPPPPTTPNRV